jgi:hypothetical protein
MSIDEDDSGGALEPVGESACLKHIPQLHPLTPRGHEVRPAERRQETVQRNAVGQIHYRNLQGPPFGAGDRFTVENFGYPRSFALALGATARLRASALGSELPSEWRSRPQDLAVCRKRASRPSDPHVK